MKKLILGCALSLFSLGAMAQVGLGLRVGANVNGNSFSAKDGFKTENVTGFHAGFVADMPIIDLVGIQAEVLFDQRGFKTSFETNGITGTSTTSLNYLTIPLMANVKIPVVDGFKITAHAGPYASMGLSGNVKSEGGGNTTTTDAEFTNTWSSTSQKAQISLVDFGAMVGVGARYQVVPMVDVFLDARYTLGFSEIAKYDKDANIQGVQADLLKSTNRQIGVSAGVLFKVGSK